MGCQHSSWGCILNAAERMVNRRICPASTQVSGMLLSVAGMNALQRFPDVHSPCWHCPLRAAEMYKVSARHIRTSRECGRHACLYRVTSMPVTCTRLSIPPIIMLRKSETRVEYQEAAQLRWLVQGAKFRRPMHGSWRSASHDPQARCLFQDALASRPMDISFIVEGTLQSTCPTLRIPFGHLIHVANFHNVFQMHKLSARHVVGISSLAQSNVGAEPWGASFKSGRAPHERSADTLRQSAQRPW